MNISKTILTIMAATLCVAAHAAQISWGTTDASISRQGDYLGVDLTLDLKDLDISSDRAVLLTPCLVNGSDTIALPAVGIYGRNRYIYYQRRSDQMISGADETVLKSSDKPEKLQYNRMLQYTPEMDGSHLIVRYTSYGCCAKPIDSYSFDTDASYRAFRPWSISPVYVAASAISEKTDSLADKAYVSFVVNRTEINPDYRDNYTELGKIRRSIDTVIDDPDCTITGVWLKGYASPEGKYPNNSALAQGRTESLREYIKNMYNFPSDMIVTDYQPEDWDGLRQFVMTSNIDNRSAILDIIDREMDPDEKEALIKKSFPAEYKFLLEQVYPTLRHTDYKIDYTIRRFTDIDDIKRVFETQPRKLDLNELYLLASQYEAGSPEFNAIYATAAKMFPGDETANLNAANSALQIGNLTEAAACLERAGDSPEATLARGILALLSEQYAQAASLLQAAAARGITQADDLLSQMRYNQVID